jgi:hypothetical protein
MCLARNAAAPAGLLKISQLRSGALKFSTNSSASALFCEAAANNSIYLVFSSISTAMPRHFPCLNRSTLNAQRIT